MKNILLISLFAVFPIILTSCAEKDTDPNDPASAFAAAREPYDDENYEMALQKLGEFKSRFPYSKLTALSELYIANCQFELGRYEESAVSYEQFVTLHPKHEKVPFAMYRIGESYWVDAPEEVDREQEFTIKSLEEWEKLVVKYPNSDYAKKAQKNIEIGKKRLAGSVEFIAKFYCKLEIYHACAYRAVKLARNYPQYKEIRKKAMQMASMAFGKLAEQKEKDPKSDKNIYFKTMTVQQLRDYSQRLKKEAASL